MLWNLADVTSFFFFFFSFFVSLLQQCLNENTSLVHLLGPECGECERLLRSRKMKRRRISARPPMSANAHGQIGAATWERWWWGWGRGGEWCLVGGGEGGSLVGGFLEPLSISSDSSQDAPAHRGAASLRLSLGLPVLPGRRLK